MSSRGDRSVLTIGHSNHPWDAFMELLHKHGVTALADVRSVPYSRFNPHFNRARLTEALAEQGAAYVYLGHELGGRPTEPSCYENGRVRYDRVAQTDFFRDGLERVVRGASEHRIALMCAEKEPLDCHRTLLVGRALAEQGLRVEHVLFDGRLEPHAAAMDRLLAEFDPVPESDLFRRHQPRDELIAEAIAQRCARAARAARFAAGVPRHED